MSSWPLGVQKEEKVLRSEVDSWEQENKSCLKDHSKLFPKGLIYAWPVHLTNKTGTKMAVSECFLELGRAAKPTGEMDVRRYYRRSLTGGAHPLCRGSSQVRRSWVPAFLSLKNWTANISGGSEEHWFVNVATRKDKLYFQLQWQNTDRFPHQK